MKTQIFQLLSALCLFSDEGNEAVLEALQDYKVQIKKCAVCQSLGLVPRLSGSEVPAFILCFECSLEKEGISLSIQLAFARAEISRDGRILSLHYRINQLLA